MPDLPIYLDHNATTPVDARVLQAMLPFFSDVFGNAASRSHGFGQHAAKGVDGAREQVASLIGCDAAEIVFTSGATESNNLAIKGLAAMVGPGKHIITQLTEHKAVLDPCKRLEKLGYRVTYLPVDSTGQVRLETLQTAITPETVLVSIMLANNETGTIQPVKEIGKLCRERGIVFHTDATQAVGHVPVNVREVNIDLLSLSAHKLYGPKGVGALYVRKRTPRILLTPLLDGGGHERGFRSGTLNVPGIVGLGEACKIAGAQMPEYSTCMQKMRDHLEHQILARSKYVSVNGNAQHRLPHTTNLSFAFVEGESLMLAMPEIAVSSGSACTSASLEPSHVLAAMGIAPVLAHSSIRFGLGRTTTDEQIEYVIQKVISSLARLRELSPLYEMAMEGVDLATFQWAPTQHQAKQK